MMSDTKTTIEELWMKVPAPLSLGFTDAIDAVTAQMDTGKVPGYKTGVFNVDKYIRMVPSEYLLVGARSGHGKTAFAMQLIDSVERQRAGDADDDAVTIFFSAEMDRETLAMRHAAKMTGIAQWTIQSGEASEAQLIEFREALTNAKPLYSKVFVDPSPSPTIQHMVDSLETMRKEYAIGFVVFDYLELSGEKSGNEGTRVATISRGMKAIAKEFKCPSLGLSQLNRDIEKRADKTPMMSDIMWGGEREPDRIILLNRVDGDENRTDFNVVKNRNGPIGKGKLRFDGKRQTFKSGI